MIKTTIDVFGWQAIIGFQCKEFGNIRILALHASETEWFCSENHDNFFEFLSNNSKCILVLHKSTSNSNTCYG